MAEERAQRRLAAILAADVVGYSRLMERTRPVRSPLLRPVEGTFSNPRSPDIEAGSSK